MEQVTYAVKNKNFDVRINSRSGGVFSALSDFYLKNNGVVFGCVLNENLEAIQICAKTQDERDKMRGSKYVQSNTLDTFKETKEYLDKGVKVLYSGTPCQIDALHSYLGKRYNNLFCIDIVCHGVPSPLIYQEFLKWNEKKYKGKCIQIDFRNKKKYGWESHIESLLIQKNNSKKKQVNSRIYTELFYSHCALRPSCYNCLYKNLNRVGDISIADYWGINNINPEFNDNNGISLVIINTEKGLELFNKIKDDIYFIKTNIEDSMQPPLKEQFKEPKIRKQFWEDYNNKGINYLIKKYGCNNIKTKLNKIIYSIKKIVKKIVKPFFIRKKG